jgi:hypothetical protein
VRSAAIGDALFDAARLPVRFESAVRSVLSRIAHAGVHPRFDERVGEGDGLQHCQGQGESQGSLRHSPLLGLILAPQNPKLFVQNVLDARAKFHHIVQNAFKADRNFARALKEVRLASRL